MGAKKFTLGLNLPTDPRWADIAGKSIEDILVDHAYCEQKAASSCISLIVQYSERTELVDALIPVVSEEWEHFERVIKKLKDRGYKLGRQRSDEYVKKLNANMKKGGSRAEQLVERLLINALIEARSCERFKTLSIHLSDPDLKDFYYELMVSEAAHYRNFIDLAKKYMEPDKVNNRWRELLKMEAEIMKNIETRSDRMH